jgi:putative ABC transport system permease protein
MFPLRVLTTRLAALFRKNGLEEELRAEVESHLELQIEENLRKGMTHEDAYRAALSSFGGVEQMKENYRDARGLPLIETLIQDLRYGGRMLARSPGFTLAAILTLALGIGANIAMFSVVNTVILHPLPFQDARSLVTPWLTDRTFGPEALPFCSPDYEEWRKASKVYEGTAAFMGHPANLTGAGEPVRLAGWDVTPSLFPLLQVTPLIGRIFLPEEAEPGRSSVVVLSQRLWQQRFASDPGIVGRSITLDAQPFTVTGVMPASFDFPNLADFWTPVTSVPECRNASLRVIARLKSGISLQRASQEFRLIARRINDSRHRRSDGESRLSIVRLEDEMAGGLAPSLKVLFAAVGLVLLIACANIANLLLAKTATRQHELGLRAALGASRTRLVRQILTESLMLSWIGAVLGVLLAIAVHGTLVNAIPNNYWSPGVISRLSTESMNGWVLGFAILIAVLAGLLAGLAPALQTSRRAPGESLKWGNRSTSSGVGPSRLRSLLLILETALALPLLIGAGLLLRSFYKLTSIDPGFNARNLLTLNIDLPDFRHNNPQEMTDFEQRALRRLAALPGVQAVGVAFGLPFGPMDIQGDFSVDGAPVHDAIATKNVVGGDYFRTMGIPLLQGRLFAAADNPQTPCVAIVSENFARRFWPIGEAIGKHIDPGFSDNASCQVIGVVGTVKQFGLDEEPRLTFYLPYAQAPLPFLMQHLTIVLRTAVTPASLSARAQKAIQSVDNTLPVSDVASMENLLYARAAEPRLRTALLGIFAILALVLCCVGIYGVMSYSVSRRTHELGIRMALGARSNDVVRLVVGHGFTLAFTGLVIGLALSLGLTRFLKSMLFEIQASDPLTFVGVSVLLALVAALACYIPARRITQVDPLVALRYE